MSISVGQTRKHGATGEITERISEVLPSAGQRAETRPVHQADDLGATSGSASRQLTRLDAGRGQEAPR
jgi:hypothetical protein